MIFRNAIKNDREFILNANKKINVLSRLDDSTFEKGIDEFLESKFYNKYENTYYVDSILKDVFEKKLSKHRVYLENYDDVYKKILRSCVILLCIWEIQIILMI